MDLIKIVFILVSIAQIVWNNRSPIRLVSLAKLEVVIYNALNEHSNILKGIPLVEEYFIDFKESSLKVMMNLNKKDDFPVTISKNPILSYRMIRRYSNMLRNIYEEIQSDPILSKIYGKIEDEMMDEWPFTLDVKDTMEALLQIYHVYDIKLEEFTTGNIMGIQTDVELNAKHCQEIGEFAIEMKQFSSGIRWLEIALNKTNNKLFELKTNILKSLEMASVTHDIEWTNKTNKNIYFFTNKLNETNGSNSMTVREIAFRQNKNKHESRYHDVNIWELCSGETQLVVNPKNNHLYCQFEMMSNPAWMINPLKIELLSTSPYIIQIYDVLTNKNIENMKIEAIPKLSKSFGIEVNYDSVKSFLSDSISTRSISRYIELMIGLNVVPRDSSESFLLTANAFGSHVRFHYDYLDVVELNNQGNRVASILFYLNDVEVGGFTAFPKIGVVVKPVKGSAILWYNLLKNGERDDRSYHGACPVVIGQKWTLLKPIRVNAQMLTRPCSLDSNE